MSPQTCFQILVLCSGLAVSQSVPTLTTKRPSFVDQLTGKLTDFGEGMGMAAFAGIMDIGCTVACPRMCEDRVGKYFCRLLCSSCGKVKRSVTQHTAHKGHLTPMPNKFSVYDLNDDGVVSIKELAFVMGQDTVQEDIKMVFNMADKNVDGALTPKELYEGPFVFEMDVGDSDYMYCKYIAERMSRTRNPRQNLEKQP